MTAAPYNALSNLDTVPQSGLAALSGQPGVFNTCPSGVSRCFAYGSQSRLSWATNPESGTTTYGYDFNGNLKTKTDSRSITTTLSYDLLSRLTGKGYNDGITPTVAYQYATATSTCPSPLSGTSYAIGRLTSVATNSATTYTYDCYDGLGRLLHGSQTTNTQNYPFTYAFNAAGSPTSITFPSGRKVTYAYDQVDRATTVTNAATSTPYWSSVLYAPNGAMTSTTVGTVSNGLVESRSFNYRFQPTQVEAKNSSTTFLNLVYSYCGSSCSTNNGNVLGQTITHGIQTPPSSQTFAQAYSYDGVNRLKSAMETGPGTSWTENYGYDKFGNRWISNAPEPGLPPLTNETPQASTWYTSSSVTNNRVSSWSYDNAGNILSVSSMQRKFTYDAENRQLTAVINGTGSSNTTQYSYDGDGHRIAKAVDGAPPTIYVYDPTGLMAAEYGTPTDLESGTQFLTADPLGTTRRQTNSGGTPTTCYDYLPFGGDLLAGTDARTAILSGGCFAPSPDSFNLKFTGKERDAESGLDFFNARYVSSAQGRFTSPDPSNLSVDFWLPQTWNRYAYVGNNPLVYVDRNGLWWTLTHNQIIDDAFPGLSSQQLKGLQDASYAVDHTTKYLGIFDSQSAEASPAHDMSNGNDADEAHALGLSIQLSDQLVQGNEAAARAAQADWIASGHTGISPNAMTAFGNALHTVADSTSPSHEGHQPWSGCWAPFCANGLWHAVRENPFRYTGARKAAAIGAARQAYLDTFGFMQLMQAIDGLKPKVTSTFTPCGGESQKPCQQ